MKLTDDGIRRRVAYGIVVLGIRRVIFQIILTLSNIVLARLLAPNIFGAFAIISFLVMTVGSFTSFGLGPALVQRDRSATKKELRAIFTALFLGSLVFALIIYCLSPLMDIFYQGQLGKMGIFWLRLFAFNLVLININLISISLLEKKLEYQRLAIGEIVVLFLTQILAIIFALKGFGIGSFALSSLIGGTVGFFLFFFFSPWPIGFNFSFADLKKFLPFGLNFQANSLVGAINGAVIPGFVGAVSGYKAVGLVNWAAGLRQFGLAPMDIMGRLIFPACARAQKNPRLLRVMIEKMTKISCLISFPILAATFALARPITYLVYTSKWLPGLTALYLSLIQGIFVLLGWIFIQVLFALGDAKKVRNIGLFWAIMQWVLTVPLVLLWNFNGVVLAGIFVSATFFIPFREVQKKVKIDLWPNVLPYLGYSLITGGVMSFLNRLILVDSLFKLLLIGGIGAVFYWGLLFCLKREEIIRDIQRLKQLILT